MEGQVDKLNASSNIDDWLVRYGYSGKNRQLSINSVSVNDSENVHFGDRTIYEGPVVIKQYILVDEDDEVDAEIDNVILSNTDDEDIEEKADIQGNELVKAANAVERNNYEGRFLKFLYFFILFLLWVLYNNFICGCSLLFKAIVLEMSEPIKINDK